MRSFSLLLVTLRKGRDLKPRAYWTRWHCSLSLFSCRSGCACGEGGRLSNPHKGCIIWYLLSTSTSDWDSGFQRLSCLDSRRRSCGLIFIWACCQRLRINLLARGTHVKVDLLDTLRTSSTSKSSCALCCSAPVATSETLKKLCTEYKLLLSMILAQLTASGPWELVTASGQTSEVVRSYVLHWSLSGLMLFILAGQTIASNHLGRRL